MKILNVNERVLVKRYVEIEIDNKEYLIYICNDIVRNIYEKVNDNTTVDTNHKALKKLTGLSFKEFMCLSDKYIEDNEEY